MLYITDFRFKLAYNKNWYLLFSVKHTQIFLTETVEVIYEQKYKCMIFVQKSFFFVLCQLIKLFEDLLNYKRPKSIKVFHFQGLKTNIAQAVFLQEFNMFNN